MSEAAQKPKKKCAMAMCSADAEYVLEWDLMVMPMCTSHAGKQESWIRDWYEARRAELAQ